ncbi:MAG: Kelch repeat-containing protein [Chloroflexota bacterium]
MNHLRRFSTTLVGLAIALACATGVTHADTGSWAPAAPLPTPRAELAAVTGPDGRIYAIGGTSGNVSLATVEAYDPATNTWTTAAPLPQPRQDLAAVLGSDGRIYVIGGVSCSRSACTYPAAVAVYDVASNTWSTVAPLPTPRGGLGAARGPSGRIYAIGGSASPNGPFATVDVYDPSSNTWRTVAPLPAARSSLAVVAGPDGRIYAIGGTEPVALGSISTVDAYNPATNAWTPVNGLPIALGGLAATAGTDGRIYAFGAFNRLITLGTAFAYTPATDTWLPIASMPTARGFLAGATGPDGRIYAVGGVSTTGAIGTFRGTVESYTSACHFALGFKALDAEIPAVVGNCLENEQHNPTNGDALQPTTGGLLVWRKTDNFTAFTDGYHTWVNGPLGLQERLNTERFRWEPNPGGFPLARS